MGEDTMRRHQSKTPKSDSFTGSCVGNCSGCCSSRRRSYKPANSEESTRPGDLICYPSRARSTTLPNTRGKNSSQFPLFMILLDCNIFLLSFTYMIFLNIIIYSRSLRMPRSSVQWIISWRSTECMTGYIWRSMRGMTDSFHSAKDSVTGKIVSVVKTHETYS